MAFLQNDTQIGSNWGVKNGKEYAAKADNGCEGTLPPCSGGAIPSAPASQ
jgi:hypothetical protein